MRMGGFIILRILHKVSFRNILHEWFLCLINIGSQSTNFHFYCIEDTSIRPLQPSHTKDTASQHKPLGGQHCALIVISFLVL